MHSRPRLSCIRWHHFRVFHCQWTQLSVPAIFTVLIPFTYEMHYTANAIMMEADLLAPNTYKYISNHHTHFCDGSIWLCTSNLEFLWVVVQIVLSWSKCVIWMVTMATKQYCRTWSQLKGQQSLLLNSTISATSWNYIFLEQDGFEVVTWCVMKNESPKICFYKCKSILLKILPTECRSFFV